MNKLKLFLENFLVYGFGGIISKLIPLIMVPIVTRLMPTTEYYGISDLSNTVVQFGSALAVMGMYDAMYRMFFEKEEEKYKKRVCSTALMFTIMTSIIVFMIMIVLKSVIAQCFFSNRRYAFIVYLSAMAMLVGATNSIISAPTRMQNKRKIYLITNTLGPLISYAVSVPMLLAGYYVIALPLAAVISGMIMEISFGVLNHEWFHLKMFDGKLLKQLLALAIPLLPNFLIYWIFKSCDKIMITNILGVGAAGIYSVSSKLGHISQLVYTAFAGGWQFFAFSTMREENQVKNNSMIFEYLGVISFVVTSFMCAWSYILFRVLFTEQYSTGYIAAPYLFFAPLLQMLFQVACNQFLVIKKTWPSMFILSIGAILNIGINWVLIPVWGIEGAAVATLTGYLVSDLVCVLVLCRMKLMVLTGKFIESVLIMVGFMVCWRLFFSQNTLIGSGAALVVTILFILIYRNDFRWLLSTIKKRKR